MTNSKTVNNELKNMKVFTVKKDYTIVKEVSLVLTVVIIVATIVSQIV